MQPPSLAWRDQITCCGAGLAWHHGEPGSARFHRYRYDQALPEAQRTKLVEMIPVGRLGTRPADIAHA